MKDTKYLLEGAVFTFGSLILIKLIVIVNSVIKARLLGPELLGVLAILYSIQSMSVLFASITLPTALAKFTAEYDSLNRKREIEKVFSTTMIVCIGITIMITSMVFIFSDLIATRIYNREDMGILIKLLAFAIALASITPIMNGALQGLKRIKLLAKISIINALITLPITYLLILKMSITGAVLAICAGTIFSLVFMGYVLKSIFSKRDIKFSFHLDRPNLKRLIKFVWPIFISQAFIIPSVWFGKTYLSIVHGFGIVGFYAVGEAVALPLLFMASAVAKPLLPYWSSHFSQNTNAMEHRKVEEVVRKVCITTQFSAIGLLLVLDYLVIVLYGNKYLESIYIAYFLIIYTSIAAINTTLTNLWFARGMTKFLMKIDIISIAVYIPILFLFVNMFGAIGLALTLTMKALSYWGLSLLQIKKENAGRLARIYLREMSLTISIGAIYILIFYSFDQYLAKITLIILSVFLIFLKRKEIVEILSILKSNFYYRRLEHL